MLEQRGRKYHQERVAETLRDEIGAMIEGELSDPRISFAYISQVVLNPGGFVDRLRTWLPGEQTDLGPIQPDIIGEAFILGAKVPLLRKPEETLLRALTERREPVLRLLIRIAQDFCLAEKNPRQEPLEWLQRIIEKGLADDFTLLRDIEEALPDSTVVLQKHAAVVTTLMIQRLSAMILKNAGQGTNLRTIVESAAMLNNLGNRLSRLGVREEALSSAVDSVEVYRELILVDRKVFLPGFHCPQHPSQCPRRNGFARRCAARRAGVGRALARTGRRSRKLAPQFCYFAHHPRQSSGRVGTPRGRIL